MITRKNLKGGRRLTDFPLVTDERAGTLGFKLGYCEGCNEPVCLRTLDAQEVLAYLFRSQKQYKHLIQKLTPKISFKQGMIRWAAKWVNGKLQEVPVYN